MGEAFIVEAVRTPIGRRRGALSTVHPADLGAQVLQALVDRAAIDPHCVDDVIFGCLDTIGPQSANIARTSWLAAGLPEKVPGVTIDRQCGSSQQAVHFAAQAVMSGVMGVVVAGGVQNMSMVSMQSSYEAGEHGQADPFAGSQGWRARYGDQEVSQFVGAEVMAERWGLSRTEMDMFSYESHQKAIAAGAAGRFVDEIVPVNGLTTDECPRGDSTMEQLAELTPLRVNGQITAGMASQIADGAVAILIASAQAVEDFDLTPRARIHHMGCIADDPILMLSAPIAATRSALERTGLTVEDIGRFEVNEAFAPVVLAWLRESRADPTRVNVNGGSIALGHPLGATGGRLLTTLVNELERSNGRYGLVTMCELGGQANVTIIERIDRR
jgi:acetyl-CoA C-acetyltransferase